MRIEVVGVPAGTEDGLSKVVAAPLAVVPIAERGDESPAEYSVAASDPLVAALDRHSGRSFQQACANGSFDGREGSWVEGHGDGSVGPERVRFVGTGEPFTIAQYRNAAGRAVRAAEDHGVTQLVFVAAHLRDVEIDGVASAVAEGLVLGAWRFGEFKSNPVRRRGRAVPPVESAVVLVCERELERWTEGVRRGVEYAGAANLARTLQARPGNVATPSHLAAEAERIAEEVGLECAILGPAELKRERMGALLSVARGSDEEPRLIVLRHSGGEPEERPVALVGKGLTFDAGGISIKPAKGMEDMKYDMSGGAAVLGAMWGAGRLGLPVNVVGIVPCSENLLNGSANKPGDVVVTRSGKSVEVINTDAEGRLLLADALDYVLEMNPQRIVDCATLTGACVVALGHRCSAVLGNDPELIRELQAAGRAEDEPCWPLPIEDEYRRQLGSDVADLKNVGGRAAGTITAACFLYEFVGETRWAHLDIAGTAYGKTRKPYLRDGPLGNPCRLLLRWLETPRAE